MTPLLCFLGVVIAGGRAALAPQRLNPFRIWAFLAGRPRPGVWLRQRGSETL